MKTGNNYNTNQMTLEISLQFYDMNKHRESKQIRSILIIQEKNRPVVPKI